MSILAYRLDSGVRAKVSKYQSIYQVRVFACSSSNLMCASYTPVPPPVWYTRGTPRCGTPRVVHRGSSKVRDHFIRGDYRGSVSRRGVPRYCGF